MNIHDELLKLGYYDRFGIPESMFLDAKKDLEKRVEFLKTCLDWKDKINERRKTYFVYLIRYNKINQPLQKPYKINIDVYADFVKHYNEVMYDS